MKRSCVLKIAIATIATTLASSYLNAWTISILNPEKVYNAGYDLPGGLGVTTLNSYLNATGADFATSALNTYSVGNSNAVIINLPSVAYLYTQAELNVLTNLFNSNTRVLIFAENSSWTDSNKQLAGILGGKYAPFIETDTQTVDSNLFPLLTKGVENVNFLAPGQIAPNEGSTGISISSDSTITLWGKNNNFLLFADVNAMDNSYINTADNNQLSRNIVSWLAGSSSSIPEPSSYALAAGIATLGLIAIRRKRK